MCHPLPPAGLVEERPQLPPKLGSFFLLGVSMPRYHFDLVDTKTVADERGQELLDDAMAEKVANKLATRLRQERPELRGRNFAILVTNQDGERICRAPIDLAN